jgi:hypothetical protein
MMTPNPKQTCRYCGAVLDPQAAFCEECGRPAERVMQPVSSQPAVFSPQPAAYVPPVVPLPAAAARKKVTPAIWVGAGLLTAALCLVVAGLGAYLYSQQTSPRQPTVAPKAVQKTIPLDKLPNLVLSTADIPTGWKAESDENLVMNNEELAKTNKQPVEALTTLNDQGRLTNFYNYYVPPATSATCQKTGAPFIMISNVDLFKNTDGARKYMAWENPEGIRGVEVGEQSVYGLLRSNSNYANCGFKYISYWFYFQRLNTAVLIRMLAFDGDLSDAAAHALLLSYAQKLDQKILTIAN